MTDSLRQPVQLLPPQVKHARPVQRLSWRTPYRKCVRMPSRPFEKVASIQLTDASGKVRIVSALIHHDPQYLYANRISLIGTREHQVGLLGFSRDGVVDWQFHTRSDWKLSEDPDYAHIQRGTGILRSIGMTQGVMIAEGSIQPFAEIEIIQAVEQLHAQGINGPQAEYLFLQRPKEDWYVHRRSWLAPEPARLAGPWVRIPALDLRFRLLRTASHRDDERITQERERIELPGVEIQPTAPMEDSLFFAAAERLWFSFRVLLAFRYRQFVHTLAEFKKSDGKHEAIWHSIRLEPRYRRRSHEAYDPPFHGRIERYLAKGAARLAQMEPQRELLHAAAFGYANSYTGSVIESSHTACVEGIERLIEAFEQVNGLTRERIDKKRWRTLGRAVRKQVRTVEATQCEREVINRVLSEQPNLRLLQRIERMTQSLPPKWRKRPLKLMEGAEAMITARNQIVHGSMIPDYNKLQIERLRAQTLFEWLWLSFFGCGNLQDPGWAQYRITNYMGDNSAPRPVKGSIDTPSQNA